MSDLFSHIDSQSVGTTIKEYLTTKGMKEVPTDLKTDFVQCVFDTSNIAPPVQRLSYYKQQDMNNANAGVWDDPFTGIYFVPEFCFDFVAPSGDIPLSPCNAVTGLWSGSDYHYVLEHFSFQIQSTISPFSPGFILFVFDEKGETQIALSNTNLGVSVLAASTADQRFLYSDSPKIYLAPNYSMRLAIIRSSPSSNWVSTYSTATVRATLSKYRFPIKPLL